MKNDFRYPIIALLAFAIANLTRVKSQHFFVDDANTKRMVPNRRDIDISKGEKMRGLFAIVIFAMSFPGTAFAAPPVA
ncbi:hypothetical protein K8I61_05275 [bacterium]|nr:hypothetical protein [bacterium]